MDTNKLLDGDLSVGSLPSIYQQFQEAMSDESTSFDEIGKIILYDSVLTARLLQIVNSPYYGFSDRIETVSDAISVVGTMHLSDLILSTVVVDKFNSIPESVVNIESFWKHSIACGLIARELASYNEDLDTEKFFVAGMLHDIGQILLCTKLPELTLKILLENQSEPKHLHEAESEELGFDHAELGAKLLGKWNLSEFHVELTKFHHNPSLAPNFAKEASILNFADVLVNIMQLGSSGETTISPELEKATYEGVELPDQVSLSDFKESIYEKFDETVKLFLQPN